MRKIIKTMLPAFAALSAFTVQANVYPMPPSSEDLVGDAEWISISAEDTLADVALRGGVGFRQMLMANPETDAWLPDASKPVLLPKRSILPGGVREGIVVNLAEMRLYYYDRKRAQVMVFPVGIGREDWKSPLGVTRIKSKVRDPEWRPTENIRAEHAAQGEILPEVVPPGPDNPLGPYALRLDIPEYLLHGTNKPFSVGMPVTHGCIRLAANHIQQLFENVEVGTQVMFVDEPYKLGHHLGQWYLEAYPSTLDADSAFARVQALAEQHHIASLVDWQRVREVLARPKGVPVMIEATLPLQAADTPVPAVATETAAPAEAITVSDAISEIEPDLQPEAASEVTPGPMPEETVSEADLVIPAAMPAAEAEETATATGGAP